MYTKAGHKFLSLGSIFCLILMNSSNVFGQEAEPVEPTDKYFMVTAYYSPVPWQRFYIQGSYEADVKMNWEGKYWASWASVRPGMIAAPISLPFGTKIDLEWLWIWTVLDRGWAIVDSWENGNTLTRLDLWTWTWEEWLCRALRFWVQTAFWKIYDHELHEDLSDTIELTSLPSSCEGLGLKSSESLDANNYSSLFTTPITNASSSDDIILLKSFLQELGFLKGGVNGQYDDSLSASIFDFQLAHWVVQIIEDLGAWYAWPKTRAKMKEVYAWESKTIQPVVDATSIASDSTVSQPSTPQEAQPLFNTIINTAAQREDIRFLQKVLRELGFFGYEEDGVYNKRLVDSIYDYQKVNDIVSSPSDVWAWYLGPKTRASLEQSYTSYAKNSQLIQQLKDEIAVLELQTENSSSELRNSLLADISNWIIPKIWSVDPDIRALQKALKELGYMEHVDTAYFGPVTKDALADFQLAHDLIDSLWSEYAGLLGTRTREALSQELAKVRYVPNGKIADKLLELKNRLNELQ